MSSGKRKPWALYVLVILLFVQGVSAIYGGVSLVVDPSGALLKMEADMLANTPFNSYLLPGLILGLLLGLVPLMLIWPLLARPHWKWARKLNIYNRQYWAWTYSLYLGFAVIIWIDVQIFLIGYSQFIQTFIAGLGVLILIFTLWPSVVKYYRRDRKKNVYLDEPEAGIL
jgi:hypothetical protein